MTDIITTLHCPVTEAELEILLDTLYAAYQAWAIGKMTFHSTKLNDWPIVIFVNWRKNHEYFILNKK